MNRLKLPEYPIPKDLQRALLHKVKTSSLSTRGRNFSRVLKKLKTVDHVDLSENHYLLLLKLALYLEERKSISDMAENRLPTSRKLERYTCKKVEEQRRLKLFQIGVGDTTEDKLFIKPGDYVDLTCTDEDYKVYSLRVTDVTQTHIVAYDEDANKAFAQHEKYLIDFRFDNYYMRCAHFALWLMRKRNSLTYLFPFKTKPFVKDTTVFFNDFKAFNTDIENNPEQKQAVLNIINRSCFPVPYILYGPTGTGKTTTLVEAMCQLYHGFPESNILVCTSSDIGADKITKMLLRFMPPTDIYHMYNQYRNIIDEEIRSCANYVDGEITRPKYEDVENKRIIITTLRDCMSLLLIGIGTSYFSHVIIDEAGRATETDVLIPVSLVSEDGKLHSQIVLAGDPQQPRPTLKSEVAKSVLGLSILERLLSYEIYQKDSNNKYNPKYITKLLQHHRSHPDIIHISNKLFYDNELIPNFKRSADEKFPVIFHGVEGKEKKAPLNSLYNMGELEVVMDYLDDLLNDRFGIGAIEPKDIGIITPFAYQGRQIQRGLRYERKAIKVGTADLFLNDERKIMIMTTTKSKILDNNGSVHLEILSDARRFNIAMTRARELLIVVGNPNVLQVDNKWHYLIKFCLDNKSYDGKKFSLDKESINKEITPKAIVDSSKLFDVYVLTLFTTDDYNPDFDPQVTEDSSLHSRYKNVTSSEGNSYASEDKTDDNLLLKKASDQVEPNPENVLKNVEKLNVNELMCTDNTENACQVQKTAVENDTLKNNSHSSTIKHSLDELNNLLQANVSQNVNDYIHTNLEDSSNFEKLPDRQDLLFETDSVRSESHFDDNLLLKKASDYVAPNPENVLKYVEKLDVNELMCSNNTENACQVQKTVIEKDTLKNISHSSTINHSLDELNNLLQINVSQNVNYYVHTNLEDSSNFEKLPDRQDLLFETDSFRSESHFDDNLLLKIASGLLEPNPENVLKNVENLDVNELLCTDNTENACQVQKTVIEKDTLKNISQSVTINHLLDELNNLLQANVSQNVNDYVHTNLEDLSNFEKLPDRQNLLFEADSFRSEGHFEQVEIPNPTAEKMLWDEQINSLAVELLKSSLDYEKNADIERKDVIQNNPEILQDIRPSIRHFDSAVSPNFIFTKTPMNDQENLIDFDCVIKIDDPFNLIEFEDFPKDSNDVPIKCDVLESDYVSLL